MSVMITSNLKVSVAVISFRVFLLLRLFVYVAVNVFNVSCAFSFVNTNKQVFLIFFS